MGQQPSAEAGDADGSGERAAAAERSRRRMPLTPLPSEGAASYLSDYDAPAEEPQRDEAPAAPAPPPVAEEDPADAQRTKRLVVAAGALLFAGALAVFLYGFISATKKAAYNVRRPPLAADASVP